MSQNRKNFMRLLFLNYSYFNNLFHLFVDILPPFARSIIFKVILKRVGKRVFIDSKVYFRYPKKIKLGNDVSINRGCEFYPSYYSKNGYIELKNNIRVGPSVKFLAAGHDYNTKYLKDTADKIIVEDDVWIGANCTILQGVKIGRGAVVAAGAVVNKNLDDFKIYGGIPAKEIKKRSIKD